AQDVHYGPRDRLVGDAAGVRRHMRPVRAPIHKSRPKGRRLEVHLCSLTPVILVPAYRESRARASAL
ncbi:MAG: hypothetical protein MPJ22_00820, partial [Pirellulales bacterium]|nr:hypothetical protein [Pirellulales bacterium]